MMFLSRGVAGHFEDKAWATYVGNRNCGKSILDYFMSATLDEYYTNFDMNEMVVERFRDGDKAKKMGWTINLQFPRIAMSQEAPDSTKSKLDGIILKKLMSGGDVQKARALYENSKEFIVQSRILMMCNDMPEIEPRDALETCFEFKSNIQFKSQEWIDAEREKSVPELVLRKYRVRDNTLKSSCARQEWKDAMMLLFIDYYKNAPLEIKQTIEDSTEDLGTTILNNFEITTNDKDMINNAELKRFIEKNKLTISLAKLKIELEFMGCKKFRNGKQNIEGVKFLKILETVEEEE
jgi:hypothetical protein